MFGKQRSESRFISHFTRRSYLAATTASGILFDHRPRRSFFRRLGLAHWVAFFAVFLINGPKMTSASAKFDSVGVLFADWISIEAGVSFTKLLANISPADAARGIMVASPSRQEPNYYFHWVRDAALSMDVIVRGGILVLPAAQRTQMMDDYINLNLSMQKSSAPTGLGEPKFNIDGTPWTLPWGRPQNDGAALRALSLSRYAEELLSNGQGAYVSAKLYDSAMPSSTVIKRDLEYVSHHWSEPSFDLWEEAKGDHFYTRIVQLAALRKGAEIAAAMNDPGAASFYSTQASAIEASLDGFWDNAGFFRSTINYVTDNRGKNSGLDSAVVLGVLHADLSMGGNLHGVHFAPSDSRVMATVERLEEAFHPIYAINDSSRFPDIGTAIGRYPEDVYSGRSDVSYASPWILTTAAMAEYCYKLAYELDSSTVPFSINDINLRFINRVSGGHLGSVVPTAGLNLNVGSPEFNELVSDLVGLGDLYMKRIRLHLNGDGSLSEQMDRNSGFMTSARDLSWSYASFITAYWARGH